MAGNGPEKVALTGATGFIGSRLAAALLRDGHALRALVRRPCALDGIEPVVGDLADPAALTVLCDGIDTVFHCAGHAHVDVQPGSFADEAHWRVNFEGTRALAEAAGRAGVKRFVHLSSVKAMAEPGNGCVDEDWPGEPSSSYGRAKRAAEAAVLETAARFGMAATNLRPAMVYGPGGHRGNLDRMARRLSAGRFPPLPETANKRSLIFVDDLVDAMRHVAADPRAAGRSYIVADADAYSGRYIYEALCQALGVPAKPWSIPAWALRLAGLGGDAARALAGRSLGIDSAVVSRLLDSACYSPRRIEQDLGWRAATGLREGLALTYRPNGTGQATR